MVVGRVFFIRSDTLCTRPRDPKILSEALAGTKKADTRSIIKKNDKYAAYQQVITDTKTTNTPFCFPPDSFSGHAICDSLTKTKNTYASIPYEVTRDGNVSKREPSKETCECKKRIDQYSLPDSSPHL